MQALREELVDLFNEDFISVAKLGPLHSIPRNARLRRTKNFELELEISFAEWRDHEAPTILAGEFYSAEDFIEFSSPSGAIYKASGIINQRQSSNSSADGVQTTHYYSVHEMEMRAPSTDSTSYIIEWVGNLSKRLIGNSNLKTEKIEELELIFGEGFSAVTIKDRSKQKGFSSILHINIGKNDIYIVSTQDSDLQKELRGGYILYKGSPPPEMRDKIRECISFVFGLPIIAFGYTEFSQDDMPLYMKSFPIHAFGGGAFDLIDLPPYPIAAGSFRNIPDMVALEAAINEIYLRYDELRFGELYWTYWHGVCASVTMSAVYFGGLCEQLQRIVRRTSGTKGGTLVCPKKWEYSEKELINVVESLDIDQNVKRIIKNKISGLNQLPQSVALDRLLKQLGLSISEVERSAWQHRNSAAHGGIRGNHTEVILNSRLLRLLFHRMLASFTGCSKYYVDYYSLRFPIRPVEEGIPPRQSD